jgi:hypothetical protein
MLRNTLFRTAALILGLMGMGRPVAADDSEAPAVDEAPAAELNEQEAAFVELMTNADMVGRFTVDGHEGNAHEERYLIQSVTKREGNEWTVQATIVYGEFNVPVPVPVQVDWAGDTPVLSVTDLSLPLLGEGFTSRVMFYGDRYAGTWQHGEIGGHMFGRIEPHEEPDDSGSEPAPDEQ